MLLSSYGIKAGAFFSRSLLDFGPGAFILPSVAMGVPGSIRARGVILVVLVVQEPGTRLDLDQLDQPQLQLADDRPRPHKPRLSFVQSQLLTLSGTTTSFVALSPA